MADGLLRHWIEPELPAVDPTFQAAIGGHPLVARILVQRGLSDLARAQAFLNPDEYTPAPPEDLPDLETACQRIERAIRAGEPLCVWGDFDVDGQSSTTLLVEALRGLGAQVTYHIPVRAKESHGINIEHLAPILGSGIRLILTCDTGISAHEALAYARGRGADVLVTDHHSLPEQLPQAAALVNPRRLGEDHPLAGLPGVGVAYQLAAALYRRAGRGEEAAKFLDLAALGIVSDVAMQTDDTRYLLQRGLAVLRGSVRTGLQVLYDLAGLQPANLSEEHLGFVIGPRLNALGRLDDANPIIEFLTTKDEGRARVLATHLEGLNARRRLLTAQVLRGAQAQIEKDASLLEQPVLVLSNPDWPAGVIGIVASELTERYNRPTVLLAAPPGQPARGSARSIEGVNITAAIAAQQHLLLGFGGHPMAAGLSLDPANLPAFRRGLARAVENALGGAAPPRPTLALDGRLTLDELSLELVADLERLAPFGPGNPPLALMIPRLTVLSSSTIGRDGSHLQVMVKDEADHQRRVLWWGGADWPLPDGPFDLACVVRASNYRGQRDVQVEWIDARPVQSPEIDLRKALAVIDQRGLDHPLPVLKSLLEEAVGASPTEGEAPEGEAGFGPAGGRTVEAPGAGDRAADPAHAAPTRAGAVLWAEGDAKEKLTAAGLPACDRQRLAPAETLLLWTTPPGRAELQAALAIVQPRAVVVFGVDPASGAPEAFLKRLAGLVKYALEQLGGQVALARLAAACAQRETAVKLGLQWLQAKGMVQVESLQGGLLTLRPGPGAPVSDASAPLQSLRALLEETQAYRLYFRTADKDYLTGE